MRDAPEHDVYFLRKREVRELVGSGGAVFIDLKLHVIPHLVADAVRACGEPLELRSRGAGSGGSSVGDRRAERIEQRHRIAW
jgi:orotidine-5'-phosphate decarboxylase